MCGIIAATSNRNIVPILMEGLAKMEYRGYDSAGITITDHNQQLQRARVVGRVSNLQEILNSQPLQGKLGIAHTRWATHGAPAEKNAHPMISNEQIALVHNGIIENFQALKNDLLIKGYNFTSDTDTEVIAHLLHHLLKQNNQEILPALHKMSGLLHGAYGLAICTAQDPEKIYALRSGSPLILGLGENENFVASDPISLLPHSQQLVYLDDGDIAEISANSIKIFDRQAQIVTRKQEKPDLSLHATELGDFAHYMLKEIFEEPQAVRNTLDGRIIADKILDASFGAQAAAIFPQVKAVQIIACGSSYYAALVAKYWLEEYAKIHTNVEIASEYRAREPVVLPQTLLIAISQSGETADTLAAIRKSKSASYLASLAICNANNSLLTRETDFTFYQRAGVEVGVASTKGFLTQLVALLLLTLRLAHHHGHLTAAKEQELIHIIQALPNYLEQMLEHNAAIQKLAQDLVASDNALFLGRGILQVIALEAALKLKEISYIHAEAFPAGELKHGPLALVDENMPVIFLIANDHNLPKVLANVQEVHARQGRIFILTDAELKLEDPIQVLKLPSLPTLLAPICYTIPIQLLAYHVAVLRGTDVDKPRNLAKSVTVE